MADEVTNVTKTDEQVVEDTQDTTQTVPVDVIQQLRDELNDLKQENELYKQQLYQTQQSPASQEVTQDDIGDDDDIITKGELKKLIAQQAQQQQALIAEMQAKSRHPDYEEVIRNNLPKVLKDNPMLLQDPYETAYAVAKALSEKTEEGRQKAEKIIKNATQPKSAETMGSAAAVSDTDRILTMSDEEFNDYVNKIKSG